MRPVLTSATALAVLCTLPVFVPLVSGQGWWFSSLAVVVLIALTGAAFRPLRLAPVLLPLLQCGLAACALTAMFSPGDALLGVVPTPQSTDTLLTLIDEGRIRIEEESPPLAASAGLSLIIAVGFGLVALVADFFAVTARAPAFVALPLAAPLLVVLAVREDGIGGLEFTLATAGYLGLLAVDGWAGTTAWGAGPRRDGEDAPALSAVRHALVGTGIASAAVAPALLLPLTLPNLNSNAVHDLAGEVNLGGETVTTTHPMVSLRQELTSPGDRAVLEYQTSHPDPDYLRTYVLDVFDGENWTMSPLSASTDHRVEEGVRLPDPPGRTAPSAERVTTEITLAPGGRGTDFLPAPYPPRELDADGEWFADPESLMVFTTGGPASGMSYEVTSTRPDPDPRDLADSARARNGAEERLLDVPADIDPRVAELTRSITGNAETPHEHAVALQDWFLSGARFEYSLRPPAAPHGTDPLTHFLFTSRIGYCEQFAAAMTLMARQAGIPARVAVGYTAGEQTSGDRWVVTESDAHAWPELHFEEHGWLRFEPTPSSGGQGSATTPSYAAQPTPGEDATAGPDGATPSPSGTGEPSAEENRGQDSEPSVPPDAPDPGAGADDSSGGTTADGSWLSVLGALACAALLAATPALARSAIRRLRFASASTSSARAHAAWIELGGDLVDLGLVGGAAESPRALALRLIAEHSLTGPPRESLWRIAMAEESARYAAEPDPPGSIRTDLHTARAGLRGACSRTRRLRAVLIPVSLLGLPRRALRRALGRGAV